MEIKLFGAACGHDIAELREQIPTQWLAAWDACHKVGKNEKNALLSLTALALLHRTGADGTLAYELSGKPFFEHRMCDFSITHTQNHVFCALISGGNRPLRIGVDAEDIDRPDLSNTNEMAARWFTENEQNAFLVNPTKESFLRIWTRKEAYCKYTGEGLRALAKIDTVTLENEGHVRFFEQKWGKILVTVCAPSDANLHTPIQINEQE